jgi:hypothetical protein
MSSDYLWLQRAGKLLVLIDLGGWLYWIWLASDSIRHASPAGLDGALDAHLQRAQAGVLALAAPHTVIIPTLGSILQDISKHCVRGQCASLETPAWQWYVFAFLALPFDCISLFFNLKAYPGQLAIAGASAAAVTTTLLVCAWVLCSLYVVSEHHRSTQTDRYVLNAMVAKRVKSHHPRPSAALDYGKVYMCM